VVVVDPGVSADDEGTSPHSSEQSPATPGRATFVAAMRLEALAIGGKVLRTGMGHVRAHAAAQRLAAAIEPGAAVVLAGISGGLDPALSPGEIVVATSVRDPDGEELDLAAVDATTVATHLRAAGRSVHLGPIVSSKTLVHGERRAELARSGALAVDMESAWVARALPDHRLVIVRLVADTAGNFAVGLVKGLVALRHVRAAIDRWPGPSQ
jgi:4-hydroxy-3-methylbut-2-enyl diphosphate reductase